MGELATYFASTRIKDINLEIIKVQNWNRNQTATEAGWNFIPTSPAIKDVATTLLYPGMGLLEGINVNEGRGTKFDFKICGAPWINEIQLNAAFNRLNIPGIKSEPVNYSPVWGLYTNENCNGLKLTITNTNSFQPVQTGLELLQLIVTLYPEYCKERLYLTVANPSGSGHLNKLTGIFDSFKKLKKKEFPSSELSEAEWKEIIQPYLLY